MSLGPLETERLVLRRPEIGDTEALYERRNRADTARYQDWAYPYPLDEARRTVAAAALMEGPVDDEWWMLTVVERRSGAIVGDVAIGQSWQGRAAEIGYTLHPDHWGRGLATEAVGAAVDGLIAAGTRRLSASTHPDNWASVRLLEGLGFDYEGRIVGGYFEGDGPEAEAGDGLLFGLTGARRARWLGRPTRRPATVKLIEIDHTNHRAVAALQTHHHQRHLVAPVATSYGDALFPSSTDGVADRPWLRAIEIDGDAGSPELVGFVMLALPTPPEPDPYLWRLLIDRWHQRRGIATAVLDQIEDRLRSQGHRAVYVHWQPGPGSPEPLYRARGYEPTGRIDDGEIEGRKLLA